VGQNKLPNWASSEYRNQQGIDAHINKPIQELDLLNAVLRVMAGAAVLSSEWPWRDPEHEEQAAAHLAMS